MELPIREVNKLKSKKCRDENKLTKSNTSEFLDSAMLKCRKLAEAISGYLTENEEKLLTKLIDSEQESMSDVPTRSSVDGNIERKAKKLNGVLDAVLDLIQNPQGRKRSVRSGEDVGEGEQITVFIM